jgi:GGDEF domain-containing protein
VTASIGVATPAADEPLHGRDLLARADRDMYDDKQRTAAAAARRPIVERRGQ